MHSLVLCAGFGTRLAPLTHLVAKPAVPLAGRTLVERVVSWLRSQDVTDVVLNLHHKPETITAVLGDGAHLGVRVRYSWEQPILGSAGGPRHAMPLLESDPFLIVNGDTLAAVDLAAMAAAFEERDADVLMAVLPNPAPRHYSGLVLDSARRVTGFVPRGEQASGSWHFIGVQIVRRSVFAGLQDGAHAETVKDIYRGMIADGRGRIHGWPVETPFFDVGTPRDYLDSAVALSTAEGASLVESGAAVDPSAQLARTVVWSGARIGARAQLTECIVAGSVSVPDGTAAARRIFMPDGIVPLDP